MAKSAGIHHVTAIAKDPNRNVAFYRDVLGLRLLKKTVNFDDPGVYHLYYGDEAGRPGTILTFFPWPHGASGHQGTGQAVETSFAVPAASLGFWLARFVQKGVEHERAAGQFGQPTIALRDPDGLLLELAGAAGLETSPGYAASGIPAEHAIRGLHGVTLWIKEIEATSRVLKALGFEPVGTGENRARFSSGDGIGTVVDLRATRGFPDGALGTGTVHHVAFRAAGDAEQAELAQAARELGLQVTKQLDRNYFRSVYFREPNGVLFEIATDDPGFAVDEPVETLGSALRLPPWFERERARIEAALPELV